MSLKESITANNAGAAAPDGRKKRTLNPLRFSAASQYEYGELTQKSSLQNPEWRVKPIIRPGSYFIDRGCRTVQDYLESNPDALRPDRIITFYKIGQGGRRVFMYQQNPNLPASAQETSTAPLADKVATVPEHMQISMPVASEESLPADAPTLAIVRETLEQFKEINSELQRQNKELRAAESELRRYYDERISALQEQVGALRGELAQAEADRRATEENFKTKDEFQKTVNGLQDQLTRASEGVGMKDLLQLLPVFAPMIQNLFAKPQQPAYPAQGFVPQGFAPQGYPAPGFDPNAGQSTPIPQAMPQPIPGVVPGTVTFPQPIVKGS